jgi:hypothetical protein
MSQLSDFGGDVELLAAFNMNDDTFIGVLAMSDAGAYVRADGQWHSLEGNNQAFLGSKVVTVQEQFLDLFDKMDEKGSAPTTDQALSYAVDEDEEDEPVEEEAVETPEQEVEEAE